MTYSQKVTLTMRNEPLEKVISAISRQSGIEILYNNDLLKKAGLVSIAVKDVDAYEALSQALAETKLGFKVVEGMLVISPKETAPPATTPPDILVITGKVTDKEGKPIEGASILIKGPKKTGVSTDKDGRFTINSNPGDILQISSVGYQPTSYKISARMTNIVITLETEVSGLSETVIMGYSTKKVSELTGSVQKVSGEVIRNGITGSDAGSMLQGRVTGLYITGQNEGDPTSSGAGIVLRGPSSIANIGTDKYNDYILPATIYSPLIVLDGVIMPRETSPGNPLPLKDVVNPNDIAGLTILKDAASTAINGSRASAGVIVVTTNKGREGNLHVNLDLKYGINTPNRGNVRFLSAPELSNYQKTYFTEKWDSNATSLMSQFGVTNLDGYLKRVLPTQQQVQDSAFDYQKYGYLNSHTRQVNISASGGNEKTRYYAGIGYYNEQSTGIDNGLARKTFRLNVDNTFNTHFSFNASINGIFDDGDRDNSGYSIAIYNIIPWAYPYTPSGALKPQLNYNLAGYPASAPNFLYDKQYNFTRIRNQQLYGSLKVTYTITDWLSASSTNSFNLGYSQTKKYTDARSSAGYAYGTNGGLSVNNSYYNSVLTSNLLTLHKKLGDHSFSLMAGQEYGTNYEETNGVNVIGIKPGYSVISLAPNIGSLYGYSTGLKQGNVNGTAVDGLIFSVFGEAGYDYKGKYFASASMRTDASTNFGKDKRYGTFYSGGLSWLLSKESFLLSSKTINLLKLRANYGTNGSQNGNNFFTQTLYDPSLQYAGQSAAYIASLANTRIGWETTRTFDGGLDFGILKNRISGSIDFYRRLSVDLIQKVSLTAAVGFPAQFQNSGNVANQGVELLLNTVNIRSKNFHWPTNINLTYNKNRLVKTYGDSLFTGSAVIRGYYIYPGEDMNSIKGVKQTGVDPQTGNALYEKLLFDGKGNRIGTQTVTSIASVLADGNRQMQTLGTLQPKVFGGMTNTFTYKNFSLSALLYFQFGNIMFNQTKFDLQMRYLTSDNEVAYVQGQSLWTTPGQKNATEPSLYAQANTDWWNQFNDHFYDNGSYVKLRNIRLAYDLSPSLLKKLAISAARGYVSGDNPFTFTHQPVLGSDPASELVADAYQQVSGAIGYNLGTPRKYLLGIQLTF